MHDSCSLISIMLHMSNIMLMRLQELCDRLEQNKIVRVGKTPVWF